MNEIVRDISKYFDGDENYWTNQQVIGLREIFRGVVVTNWVAMPLERVNFLAHNKIIVREAVKFYSECWKERCKALHTPEYEISSLREEIKQIKMQEAKEDKVNFETYVNLYPMNENETSVCKMKSWVKIATMFRANAKENVQQDTRKFRMIRRATQS